MITPKYRGITKEQIPLVEKGGAIIKVIAGQMDGIEGPIRDLAVNIAYFDVTLNAETAFEYTTQRDSKVFVYIVEGTGYVDDMFVLPRHCALYGEEGDYIKLSSKESFRFLLVTGNPLNESIAWGGPIVMNTKEELAHAFRELKSGTFIKTGKSVQSSRNYYRY